MDSNYKAGFEWLTQQTQERLPRYEMKEYVFPNGSVERWFTAFGESITHLW